MSNIQRHQEAHEKFNSRDWDGLRAISSDALVYEDQPRAVTSKGTEEFISWLQDWSTTFSDANVANADYIDGGEWTIARFAGRGLNDGPVGPMPASGKNMDMPFCELLHWDAEGRMDRGEIYYDQVTMMTQLGFMEAPATA